MNYSLHYLYNELYAGYKYFLAIECPDLSSAHISSLANRFAVKNTWHLYHYKPDCSIEKLFGNGQDDDCNIEKEFCISGHIRLWLIQDLEGNVKFAYDAGNGWYAHVKIKS